MEESSGGSQIFLSVGKSSLKGSKKEVFLKLMYDIHKGKCESVLILHVPMYITNYAHL